MKESMISRLEYVHPTCVVLDFSEQEPLLAGSPPEVNPGNTNVSVIDTEKEEEEISGARAWIFFEDSEFK